MAEKSVQPAKKTSKPVKPITTIEEREAKERQKLEKKINKEYQRIRYRLEEVRRAYMYVDSADAFDDISSRLKRLEKAARKVRRGHMLTRGARVHKSLLRKLSKR